MEEELKRVFIEEGYITEEDYPLRIKPNFCKLGSIIEILPGRGWQISFVQDDSLRDLPGLKPKALHEEYILSDYPVDILSFDKNFFETDIAQRMIFKGERSGFIHNFTMDFDPGCIYLEKLRRVQRYMRESRDFNSSISFTLKK